jgi:hypothetical protein
MSADYQQERPESGIMAPESSQTIRQASYCEEDIVGTAWRHAELGRNDPASPSVEKGGVTT